MPPPLSLSMDAAAAAAEDGADDSKPAIATRSRASLVDVDLSLAALDATAPAYPGLRACDRCRDRKVRCDRKSPRCTICVKRNESCITTPLLPHQRGGKPWTEADLALAAMSPSATVAAAASGLRPQSVASSSSFGSRLQQGKEDDERGGSSSAAATVGGGGGRLSQKRPRTRTSSASPFTGGGREEATTAWAAAAAAAGHANDDNHDEEQVGASTSARMRMGTNSPPSPATALAGSVARRTETKRRTKTATTSATARRRRGEQTGRRNDDAADADEINVNANTTMSPVPPGLGSSPPFSAAPGIMTGSPSSHYHHSMGDYVGFESPFPQQQQQQRNHQPRHQRQTSSSSLQYRGQSLADNDDDDDDDDDDTMSASAAAVATPGSHYSISSSAMGEHVVIPPRIHASSFFGEEGVGANQNHLHLNGGNGGGYDLKKKKKRETRRALVRVLVEGREAPFDKVRLEGVDLPRLISQVELCDSAYSPPPPPATAPHPRPSSASPPPPPPPPPPLATTSSATTASSIPPPLFSTSQIPRGELYQPTSHQSHLCISTYFSRLEPALELFLPGPTVAHRFLQECNAHWGSAADSAGADANGAGDPTTMRRKGWRSTYLASMAMGAMAMTEAEWASIGCTENKAQAGATWLEEAGRLLVESGFARKPTCETFRASLLVIQSCLIGLNGPPDIPVVLENLAQITAAAYELGLHVEPADAAAAHSVNQEGEGGGGGGDDADERRALWWRFLELQLCWAPLLDRQSSLDPASYSTLPPPSSFVPPPVSVALSPYAAQSPTTGTASLKRKADTSADAPADHQLMLAQQQQQQQAAATALASLHAVLDFSCRAYHASTAPRPPRPREVDKLSQRLLDLVESQAAAVMEQGGNAAMAMAELLLDVEVCRLQAMMDEVGVPKDDELEEVWKARAARLVAANPLAGPQVSHTLAITVYLHGLVLIALRLRGDHATAVAAASGETTPTLQEGMSTALETLRTAPWPLPLHQIIQRGIALLEALLPPAPVSSAV